MVQETLTVAERDSAKTGEVLAIAKANRSRNVRMVLELCFILSHDV